MLRGLEPLGSLLTPAAGIALSPIPVIAVVVVVASSNGRAKGVAFAGGWLVGLGLLTVAVAVLVERTVRDDTSRLVLDLIRVLAGVGLIYAAWTKWQKRPPDGEGSTLPGWIASIDEATMIRTARLGALLGGANPKNLVFAASAAASIALAGEGNRNTLLLAVVFVALSSITVLGAVALKLIGGARAEATLGSVHACMIHNANIITIVILVLIGTKIAGDGLSGLLG
jgi:threonine/homoserine/homoserine lactone efflux protein